MLTSKWVIVVALPLVLAAGSFFAAQEFAGHEAAAGASVCEAAACISLNE